MIFKLLDKSAQQRLNITPLTTRKSNKTFKILTYLHFNMNSLYIVSIILMTASKTSATQQNSTITNTNTNPDPNKWCSHPADCASDESCCLCNCAAADAALGIFGCHCKSNGMPEPNSQQTQCCGGQSGFKAWCAKANTPSATAPKCNTTYNIFGVPTPATNFYRYGQHKRCVKQSVGCRAGYCDNPSPDGQHRGICNRL